MKNRKVNNTEEKWALILARNRLDGVKYRAAHKRQYTEEQKQRAKEREKQNHTPPTPEQKARANELRRLRLSKLSPDEARAKNLKANMGRYGVIVTDEMLRLRPSKCRCGREGEVVFDHCHAKNVFRGWLCRKCNLALGYASDNPEILQHLIDYLQGK